MPPKKETHISKADKPIKGSDVELTETGGISLAARDFGVSAIAPKADIRTVGRHVR